jgi:dTDP-4-amino-4,6-dideoxygalactose transaminase
VEGTQRRRDRRSRRVQLPPEQEHDDDRRRRLVVNDGVEASRVDALRFHGITYRDDRTRDVAFAGGKFNLPDVNARIGVAQLEALPGFLAKRRALVARYFERFATEPSCLLPCAPREGDGQSWNMFSVLLPLAEMAVTRQQFRATLEAKGIGTGVSYEALHLSTLAEAMGTRKATSR